MAVGLSMADQLPGTPSFLIAIWMLGLVAVVSWLSNIFYRRQFSATAG
jgi:hypothetical protein